jgi:predicted ATPase
VAVPDNPLDRVEIEGFTSISDATVDLGRLNVLVGANGAGKSNFVRALELLGRIVDEDLRVHVARNGGASQLLSAAAPRREMRLALQGARNDEEIGYQVVLEPTHDDALFFLDEEIWFRRLPRFTNEPSGARGSIGRGHRETALHEVAADGHNPVAESVIEVLRGCRVFHFHDTSAGAAVKAAAPTADNVRLHPDAGNLAAFLLRLRDSDLPAEAAAYRRIVRAIRQVAPFFRDFVLEPETTDRVRLRWRENGTDQVFSAHQMSDGTLRFVCLAALLLQPDLPALVVLDEPELGLHPYAIVQLSGLLRQAAERSQAVVATQSVTLMNQFELADLIVVERGDGGSTFVRPDPRRLEAWLQEYSLGELWEKNLLGGRPGSVPGLADGE